MSGLENSQDVTDDASEHAEQRGEAAAEKDARFTEAPKGSSADDDPNATPDGTPQ